MFNLYAIGNSDAFLFFYKKFNQLFEVYDSSFNLFILYQNVDNYKSRVLKLVDPWYF